MKEIRVSRLSSKKRYLQIALNSTLEEAEKIISQIPLSDRILLEAGTPLIKRYGEKGIELIKQWYEQRVLEDVMGPISKTPASSSPLISLLLQPYLKGTPVPKNKIRIDNEIQKIVPFLPYVVADLKTMDRGKTEVEMSANAGADAAIALGHAPIECLNSFIQECEDNEIDSMVDMMNVEFPLSVLRQLKKVPRVVILHRGVDEETFNKEKQIPLYEIRRILGNYDILISVAGGDTIHEVQRAVFNDADIVVVWKSFYQSSEETSLLAEQFLKEIK
jgi:bifunctional enzyme Fae/Hps